MIEWGGEPHEQFVDFTGPDGERFSLWWSPLAGEFALTDLRTGEIGRRHLRDGEWVGDEASTAWTEAHERIIGLASSAVADYLGSTRQGRPPRGESGEPGETASSPEAPRPGPSGD